MEHVSKVYAGRGPAVEALRDVNLVVEGREFMAILGPSGSGKSTLLEIVAGLTAPTHGRVLVDGVPVDGPAADRAMVFQEYALFPWRTATENLQFVLEVQGVPRRAWAERCERYLDLVHLWEFRHAYPHQLSGGMRQRLALARALIGEPAILLMDEPFAAADAISRRGLQLLLCDLLAQAPRTVLLVTHSIEESLLLADRVALFTAAPGQVDEVLRVPGEPGRRRSTDRPLAELAEVIWGRLEAAWSSLAPQRLTRRQAAAPRSAGALPHGRITHGA